MRILLLITLCCYGIICRAQDGDHSDYRKKNESFSRVYDKDIRSDLASFTIGGIEESLGKTPLKKLEISRYDNNSMRFDGTNIIVSVKTGIFDRTKHKLGYEEKYLLKIDGKPYYGDYGKLPKTTMEAITVIMGTDTIYMPPAAIADLYNPVFNSADAVYFSADKRRLYVYMLNKDNAGSYEVTWIIQDKKYLRRILDYGFSKP